MFYFFFFFQFFRFVAGTKQKKNQTVADFTTAAEQKLSYHTGMSVVVPVQRQPNCRSAFATLVAALFCCVLNQLSSVMINLRNNDVLVTSNSTDTNDSVSASFLHSFFQITCTLQSTVFFCLFFQGLFRVYPHLLLSLLHDKLISFPRLTLY